MSTQSAAAAKAERFLRLLASERILFDASEKLRARGAEEFCDGLTAERRKIVEQLGKLQFGAYAALGPPPKDRSKRRRGK